MDRHRNRRQKGARRVRQIDRRRKKRETKNRNRIRGRIGHEK